MAGFLYFIETDKAALTVAEADEVGLGYAFEPGSGVVCRQVTQGPAGGAGVVFAPAGAVADHRVGYHRDKQSWQVIHGTKVCLGHYHDDPPGPDDLARREMIQGHTVVMGDGNPWLVPVARGWTEQDGELRWYQALPAAVVLGGDGSWTQGGVVAKYRPLWDVAIKWWDAVQGGVEESGGADAVAFEFEGLADAAVLALQANYRLGRDEASVLGLLTTDSPARVMGALTDQPTLLALGKKKMSTPSQAPGG